MVNNLLSLGQGSIYSIKVLEFEGGEKEYIINVALKVVKLILDLVDNL